MFDDVDNHVPTTPPTLGPTAPAGPGRAIGPSPYPAPTTRDGVAPDVDAASPPQHPHLGPELRRRRRPVRERFGVGVAVGALAMGTFALGGAAGLTLAQTETSPTSPVPGTPVAIETGGALPTSVHELVTAARPSIVAIHTEISGTDAFGQPASGQASGTGWVLTADGLIVTNAHVVDGATLIEVSFDDGATIDATLVGADQRSDLAVLQVDRSGLTPLPVGDSDAIRVGDGVVAIGNALDLGAEPTVTGGMVSAKDRSLTEPNGAALVNLIQTDAAISPGNSGGPLLDLTGRVIGINTAVAGQGQNIGFAISINPAMNFIEQLRTGQAPDHALLGVNSAAPGDGSAGAVVTDVVAGSAADAAGLEPGDVITALDGTKIGDPGDLATAIAQHRVGDTVTIDVTRNGQSLAMAATLGAASS